MWSRMKGAFTSGASTPVSAGLYHFMREIEGRPVRYHLRVETDGSGTLIANAMAAARLSPTGVVIAHAILSGRGDALVRDARRMFRGATPERLRDDVQRVGELVMEMPSARGRYPLRGLEDPESPLQRDHLSAPLSAVVMVEDAGQAKGILRRLWEAGIPQVVLEAPAAGADLVALVEHAEDLGLIAGVRGRASDLPSDRLADLAAAGLDHLDLGWASPGEHDALYGEGDRARAEEMLERCQSLELCPVAVTPLVGSTVEVLDDLATDLAARRVGAWTVFAIAAVGTGDDGALGAGELRQAAATLEELADHFSLNLLWAPPVEWDPRATIAELVRRGPRTSGEAGIRIEADGSVVSPIGPSRPAGNLASDDWATVWSHARFDAWRAAGGGIRCDVCPGLAVCSGGCPAEPATWARAEAGDP